MRGHSRVAAALLLGFDSYLRHSELRYLRVRDLAFKGDPRLQGNSAAVFIFSTKVGRKQWVPIRCEYALGLISSIAAISAPDDFLFGVYRHSLLNWFKQAQMFGYACAYFRHLFAATWWCIV